MILFFAWLNLVAMLVMGFTYTIGFFVSVKNNPDVFNGTVLITGLIPVVVGAVFSLLVITQ